MLRYNTSYAKQRCSVQNNRKICIVKRFYQRPTFFQNKSKITQEIEKKVSGKPNRFFRSSKHGEELKVTVENIKVKFKLPKKHPPFPL